jgi:tetraacyldisaccharide 4'-kinase
VSALSAVYGGVARLRRSWYERRPASRARLPRPVISVGNIVVGGSGKTPVVAALATVLTRMGHRPAILSRGYGRTNRPGDVVIVSDGTSPLVPVEESGDEPQMLARDVAGVPIVVCADRFRAGVMAIERFNPTTLILDDGFQHLQLARTIDLLVIAPADLTEQVLPSGRLREPLSAARTADAVLVFGDAGNARRVAGDVGVSHSFFVTRRLLPLRPLSGPPDGGRDATPVAAVAGIARPERFFEALRHSHDVVRELVFADHHWFTASDVREVERQALEHGAVAVVTTAKDGVRLERHRAAMSLPWAILPIQVSIEPGTAFESWLQDRL